ncbi:RHS repeat-associated core domain-containing protein, partial [Desulforamulus aeronauticus]
MKDANGNKTNYVSDEWGRLKRVTNPQGNYHAFDYDIINRTKTTTFVPADTGVAENHYVETYDQWGRTISRKGYPDRPGGPTTVEEKYEYDLAGNLTKLTDAKNNATRYGYDALNRLTKVTNALGETTDYDYDRLGDLSQINQYQGTITFPTEKQYSERGTMVSKQLPAGQPITYKYNANGLPVEIKDASGKITTTQYYKDNNLAETRINQDKIKYYYSPLGGIEKYQPINNTTGNGEPLTYDFYTNGLTKQRKTANYSVNFQYDLLGNKTKVIDPVNLLTNYQYNNLNRLTTVTADGKNFTYEYYADGMIKAVNYPQLANGSTIRTEYTYDNINRLKTMKNLVGGQIKTQYSYSYDNNSNITSITENGQTTNYTYDALNRLTGIQRPNGEQISYQYDSRGNRILTSANDKSLDGFIPGDFSYNNWDELATFTTGGKTYSYSYDPEGLRNKKVTPSGTTRYHYDNEGRVIAETNDSGVVTAQTIWGHNALARKINGNCYYYLYNGHGDVTQVMDQNGNIVNNYAYDEWGNILTKQEQVSNPLKYAGEYYDEESGLYYLRSRYYDPTIGRFISRDSYEGEITNPLSLNLYTYVENDPLSYVDPSGHSLIGAVIGIGIGVAIGISTGSSRGGSSHSESRSSGGSSSKGSISVSNSLDFIGSFINLFSGKYSDQWNRGGAFAEAARIGAEIARTTA